MKQESIAVALVAIVALCGLIVSNSAVTGQLAAPESSQQQMLMPPPQSPQLGQQQQMMGGQLPSTYDTLDNQQMSAIMKQQHDTAAETLRNVRG